MTEIFEGFRRQEIALSFWLSLRPQTNTKENKRIDTSLR